MDKIKCVIEKIKTVKQNIIERILTVVIAIVFIVFFRSSLDVFQGINFVQDIANEMKSQNYVENYASFYVFLIGFVICMMVLLYPFKYLYTKYGLNKKIFKRKNDE